MTPLRPPVEVLENESGDAFFAPGHVDPRIFLAAVNVHLAENDAAAFPLWHAAEVDHVHCREVEDDAGDDVWVRCSVSDPGAEPWTMITADLPPSPTSAPIGSPS